MCSVIYDAGVMTTGVKHQASKFKLPFILLDISITSSALCKNVFVI